MDKTQSKPRFLFKKSQNTIKIKGKKKRNFLYNIESIENLQSDNVLFENATMLEGEDPTYNDISLSTEHIKSPHMNCSIKLTNSKQMLAIISNPKKLFKEEHNLKKQIEMKPLRINSYEDELLHKKDSPSKEKRSYVTYIVDKVLEQKKINEKQNSYSRNYANNNVLTLHDLDLSDTLDTSNSSKNFGLVRNNSIDTSSISDSIRSEGSATSEKSIDLNKQCSVKIKQVRHVLKFENPVKRPPIRKVSVNDSNKNQQSENIEKKISDFNKHTLETGIPKLNCVTNKDCFTEPISSKMITQVGTKEPSCNVIKTSCNESSSFKMPYLPIPLELNVPKIKTCKPSNSYQKDDDVISLYAESSIVNMDYQASIAGDVANYCKVQNWVQNSQLNDPETNGDINTNENNHMSSAAKNQNDLNKINVVTSPIIMPSSINNGSVISDCQKLFQYICPKIKKYGHCRTMVNCFREHDFPQFWEQRLMEDSFNDLISFYEEVKTNTSENYIWQKLFPIVAKRLAKEEKVNKLANLVIDVMKKEIDQDKTPFVITIIETLQTLMEFPFTSSVEFIFQKAKLNDVLKNSLADILLGIVVEKTTNLDDTWFVINKLTKDRNNVDTGIIQDIITIALKEPISQHILKKIYVDILTYLENTQLNSFFDSILTNYIVALKNANFNTEADTLESRWKYPVKSATKQDIVPLLSLPYNHTVQNSSRLQGNSFPAPVAKQLPQYQYNSTVPTPPLQDINIGNPLLNQQPLVRPPIPYFQNRSRPNSKVTPMHQNNGNVQLDQRHRPVTNNYRSFPNKFPGIPQNHQIPMNEKIKRVPMRPNHTYIAPEYQEKFENNNRIENPVFLQQNPVTKHLQNTKHEATNASSSTSNDSFSFSEETASNTFLSHPPKEMENLKNTIGFDQLNSKKQNLSNIVKSQMRPRVLNKTGPSFNSNNCNFQPTSQLSLYGIKDAYSSENTSEIIQGIHTLNDSFINEYVKIAVAVIISENHNIPTFYNNICDALVVYDSKKENKNNPPQKVQRVLMTLGMNLLVQFAKNNNWGISIRLLRSMINYFKTGLETAEVFYNNEKYSTSRNILTICHTFLKDDKFDAMFVLKLLTDNSMISRRPNWRHASSENDVEYRNFIINELINSLCTKSSKLALIILIRILKYQNSEIDISCHIKTSLKIAIDNNIECDYLEELHQMYPKWAYEVDQFLFRALAVILFKNGRHRTWPSIFNIGSDLDIYPQHEGSESTVDLPSNLCFEEVYVILRTFLAKRKDFQINQAFQIRARPYQDAQPVPFINILGVPISSKDMRVRIANVCTQKLNIKITCDPIQIENHLVVINSHQLANYFRNSS